MTSNILLKAQLTLVYAPCSLPGRIELFQRPWLAVPLVKYSGGAGKQGRCGEDVAFRY
ncbi:hypothetical protein [Desulfobulbus alkaliphilus]|uniref:hypothetical protein n=1 Tax=Desulfobulbus alkaliphilus TaxID=869814 RepID=UPI001963B41B|nr:hypothetical protein [Desulfobulbus alkaliphilus]MBM9537297.1 hypothetical protein [Desulfobulbus alkaliphilus]